jgi:uncharacterized repeat protein (TIGR02543 family)
VLYLLNGMADTNFYWHTTEEWGAFQIFPQNPVAGNINEAVAYTDITLPAITFKTGSAFPQNYLAELNNWNTSSLYQDVATVPGKIYEWSFDHVRRFTNSRNVAAVVIGKSINESSDYEKNGYPTDRFNKTLNRSGMIVNVPAVQLAKNVDWPYGHKTNTLFRDILMQFVQDYDANTYADEVAFITAHPEIMGKNLVANYGNTKWSITFCDTAGGTMNTHETYTGTYTVPPGQGETVFGFVGILPTGATENQLDNISFKSGSEITVNDEITYSGETKIETETRADFAYTLAEVRGSTVIGLTGLSAKYDESPVSPAASLGNGGWYRGFGTSVAGSHKLVFTDLVPSKTYRLIGIPEGAINAGLNTNMGAADVLDDGYYKDSKIAPASVGGSSIPSVSFTLTDSNRKATATVENARYDIEYALLNESSPGSGRPDTAVPKKEWLRAQAGEAKFADLALDTNYYLVARPLNYPEITYDLAAYNGSEPTWYQFTTPTSGSEDVSAEDVARPAGDRITVQSKEDYDYQLADPNTGALLEIDYTGNVPGEIVFSGLDAAKTYQVVSQKTGESWLRGVRVYPYAEDVGETNLEVNYERESVAAGTDATAVVSTALEYGIKKKDTDDWVIGNGGNSASSWIHGNGTSAIDLNASSGVNILNEVSGTGGTVVYRLFSSYDGAKVVPVSTLDFDARPPAPALTSNYAFDYTNEKVNIGTDGLEWAQSGSTDWTGKGSGDEITFGETGWGGVNAETFKLRRAAVVGTSFASPVTAVTIMPRPLAPDYDSVTETDGDLTIHGLNNTAVYEHSTDNAAWTPLSVTGGNAVVTGTNGVVHYIRFAVKEDAPVSYARIISTPININPIGGTAVYGYNPTDIPIPVTVNNTSDVPVAASATIVTGGGLDGDKFLLNENGNVSIPAEGTNSLYHITPVAGLDVGTYHATLKLTFDYDSADRFAYADITFSVTKADWNMSGVATGASVTGQSVDQFTVNLKAAPAGAVLRYQAGLFSYETIAGDDERAKNTVGASDKHEFTGLGAEHGYRISVVAKGDNNHNESAAIDLGYAYTAYSAPNATDVIRFDYANESLKFASGINPDHYRVSVVRHENDPRLVSNAAIGVDGYLSTLAAGGAIDVSVKRVGSPYADSAWSAPITAGGKTDGPSPKTIMATGAQSYTGKITLTGNFEYSEDTSGVWASATGSIDVRAGSYLVRRPATTATFASKVAPAIEIRVAYPLNYFANGGTGTLDDMGGNAKDAMGADSGEAANKYIAGTTDVDVLPVTGGTNSTGLITAPLGYKFTGWGTTTRAGGDVAYAYNNGAFTPPAIPVMNATVNLYARWAPDFTDSNWAAISFKGLEGATTPSAGTLHVLKPNDAFAPGESWPENPTKLGYVFAGWNNSDGTTYPVSNDSEAAKNAVLVATGDITLTATWTDDISVASVWKTVGFAGYSAAAPATDPPDAPPAIHTNGSRWSTGETWPAPPSRTGYNFNGWRVGFANYDPNASGNAAAEAAARAAGMPVTATARWVELGYDFKVVFDADGGSDAPDNVYSNGTTLSALYPWPDNPAREGYTFLGWNDGTETYSAANDSEAAKDAVIEAASKAPSNAGNMTLKAVWQDDIAVTAVWKMIAFDTAGGVPASIDPLHTNGVRFANYPKDEIWPANPSMEGYTFTGWKEGATAYAADNGSAQAKAAALASGRNMAFVATWKKIEVPVEKVPVTSVKIDGPETQTFEYCIVSDSTTLAQTVTVLPANADNKAVTWASDDPSVATVDAAGLVAFTGKEGTVTITAAAADGSGVSGSKTFTVVKHVVNILVALKTVNVSVKKKVSLAPVLEDAGQVITGSKITYKSSNAKVARVDAKGNVTGLKAGKAVVTITAANGKSAKVSVAVVKKAVKLKAFTLSGIKKGALSLKAGKMKALKIKLSPAKATDLKVSFGSSKKGVATVDAAGEIRAVKKGKTTITVKVGGKTVKVTLTVK